MMAGGAPNVWVPLYQFTFVKNIFPILIEMVTILAIDSLLHMELVWKMDRGSFFP